MAVSAAYAGRLSTTMTLGTVPTVVSLFVGQTAGAGVRLSIGAITAEETKMTEYEKLRTIRASILAPIGGVLVYSKSKDRNPMDSVHEVVRDIKNRGIQVDPSKCDRDQLFELGFRPYQQDTTLLLLPLWVYPFMHPKASVTDIYGAVGNFEDAAQIVDVLQGCLPYGVRSFEIAETPKLPLRSDSIEV